MNIYQKKVGGFLFSFIDLIFVDSAFILVKNNFLNNSLYDFLVFFQKLKLHCVYISYFAPLTKIAK